VPERARAAAVAASRAARVPGAPVLGAAALRQDAAAGPRSRTERVDVRARRACTCTGHVTVQDA
ncbi:hypothetical protein, partial [Streptomyces sp. NPDC088184]|uniref:hypothetical protein n=1 Tax=Streptomyces sp. NPDC088184 TaxID=3160991 RepID=UPI0034357F61